MEKLIKKKWGLFCHYSYLISCKEDPYMIISAENRVELLQTFRYFEKKHPGCHRHVKRTVSVDSIDEQIRKERLVESMDEKSGEVIACLVLK